MHVRANDSDTRGHIEKLRNQNLHMPDLIQKLKPQFLTMSLDRTQVYALNKPADNLSLFLPSTITQQRPCKTLKQRHKGHWGYRAEERVLLPSEQRFPKTTSSVYQTRGSNSRSPRENSSEESPGKCCPDLVWSNPAPLVSSQHWSSTATTHQG